MKIKLTKGCQALPSDIENLVHEIGRALPIEFLDFIRKHDGSEPEPNIVKFGNNDELSVNGFIPVHKIHAERANIENIPVGAFPVAWAEGGNYIFIDGVSGTTYFWDHELPHVSMELAPDFWSFIEMLEPFDASSIKLKPGQVKSAWIDPDFLRSLGK